MTKPDSRTQSADQLRRLAEEAIEKRAGMPPDDLDAQTPEEIRLIFHELYVHQIELEMQNEELRLSQEALDRERSRYLDLYDLAPAGYCTLSDQGVVVEANRTAATLLGVDRNALIDQSLYHFIDVEDRDIFYLQQKNDFCEPQACELRMVKADNTVVWVHLATSAVRDIEGRRECRLVMSDITERKRADEALRKSEEHYRRIVETAREGIWEFDQNWHTTYTNPKIAELLGVESKDMAGRPFDDFIYAEDEADHIRRLQQGEQSKSETYERRLRRNDGQELWVLISSTSQIDPEGRFIGSFAMLTDITRRKRAEELLKQSEQHVREVNNLLRMVLDTIPVRLFWKDLALTFLGCNRLFAQDAGFQVPEELIGLDDYSMGWSEQAEKYRRDDFEVITSGKPKLQYEEIQTTPDGKQIWLSTSKVPLRDAEGKTIGVLGSYEDITRRKLIEEELIKVQKIESLGLLAGGMAHDFNNILMLIMGNISLARSHFTPADSIYERLTTIETAAMKAKELSEQFLTFAKGGDPVKQPIAVDSLVRTYSRLTLSGTQSTCEYSFADDLWTIDADEGLIGQALTNILINADQATPDGGTIKVSCENVIIDADDERAMKSGRYVKIAIKDQGEGIPEEHLARCSNPILQPRIKAADWG
jgi:two-component system, cell cycle sensor histidine kinase and response regulator CckA